jgi:hypothetical protein
MLLVSTAYPLLDCSNGDQQIVERQNVSFGGLLALDLPHQPSTLSGYRMNRNEVHQFLNVSVPTLGCFRGLGPKDSMHELGHGDRRKR